MEPKPPARRTKHAVAVVGSGPAGLACAAPVNHAGHHVVVLERDDRLGGLLRYGIPDFKLEKWILGSRIQMWKDEGIECVTGAHVGVTKLSCDKVERVRQPDGRPTIRELPGTGFELEADLVLLAMGFASPERQGLLEQLGVALDTRGHVATDGAQRTSVERIFSAGDMRRGQSLLVWALSEGRKTAHAIDRFLMGRSDLPSL